MRVERVLQSRRCISRHCAFSLCQYLSETIGVGPIAPHCYGGAAHVSRIARPHTTYARTFCRRSTRRSRPPFADRTDGDWHDLSIREQQLLTGYLHGYLRSLAGLRLHNPVGPNVFLSRRKISTFAKESFIPGISPEDDSHAWRILTLQRLGHRRMYVNKSFSTSSSSIFVADINSFPFSIRGLRVFRGSKKMSAPHPTEFLACKAGLRANRSSRSRC